MSAADHLQGKLFDMPKAETTELSFGPEWHYHASKSHALPQDHFRNISPGLDERAPNGLRYYGANKHPLGIHVGTVNAALDRSTHFSRVVHPVMVDRTEVAPPPNGDATYSYDGRTASEFWDDDSANGTEPAATRAVRAGKIVEYVNHMEDEGSISIRAPRHRLQTWAESVVQNPSDHSHAERKAVRDGWNPVYMPPNHPFTPELSAKGPRGVSISDMEVDRSFEGKQTMRGAWARPYPPKPSLDEEETVQGSFFPEVYK